LQGVGVIKASAVRLILNEGKAVGPAARDRDLTETAVSSSTIPTRGTKEPCVN